MNPTLGKPLPFQALDETGKSHANTDYLGQWLLVYFYPKDSTPGCTTEACTLRDAWGEFSEYNIAVLGVSPQGAASHQKFKQKHALPFPLLVDEDKTLARTFGVWEEKTFMGRAYMGVKRSSFLFDPQGNLVRVYEKVKPAKHANEVLSDVQSLS
mgnify:CR=1 FL=1